MASDLSLVLWFESSASHLMMAITTLKANRLGFEIRNISHSSHHYQTITTVIAHIAGFLPCFFFFLTCEHDLQKIN